MAVRRVMIMGVLAFAASAAADEAPPTAANPGAERDPNGAANPPVSADAAATAKTHADAGGRLFDVQQYDKAAIEFEQAYLLDAQPVYLYALAQAQRLAGDCTKAVRSYENLLRTQPDEKLQALANANIERCKQHLAEHPPEKPQVVTVSAPGPAATITAEPVPPSPWYEDRVGHALVGSGVGVAAAGFILYVLGERTIRAHNTAASYDEFQATAGDLGTARLEQKLGVSAMAVGGGLIVSGVVHYILYARTGTERAVAGSVTGNGASVTLGWTF